VCADASRDATVLCVIEEPKDAATIEKASLIKGRYHILGGAISPLDGIGPEDLRVQELLDRVERDHVTEVILATNPNLEGNDRDTSPPWKRAGTADAAGERSPVGGDLEYADEARLSGPQAAARCEEALPTADRVADPVPSSTLVRQAYKVIANTGGTRRRIRQGVGAETIAGSSESLHQLTEVEARFRCASGSGPAIYCRRQRRKEPPGALLRASARRGDAAYDHSRPDGGRTRRHQRLRPVRVQDRRAV
jgi:hypothetical protein